MDASEENHERGDHQSPINIDLTATTYDPDLEKALHFTNHRSDCHQVLNKGTTWSIELSQHCGTRLKGKHLPGTYRLADVHAHWGTGPNDGSEHKINNNAYAAEIHMVHFNEAYGQVEAAKRHGDGVAVIGILLQESPHDNPALEPLIAALKLVPYAGLTAKLQHGLNLSELLPSNKEFCTYCGSLTTPPYTECVVWTVFVQPVPASKRQLDVFRSLNVADADAPTAGSEKIINNNRSCQPLLDRTVTASFQY